MLAASGCVFIPHLSDSSQAQFEERIEQIRPGETTRDEISKMLGGHGIALRTYANDRFWVYSWVSNPGIGGILFTPIAGEMVFPRAFAIEFSPDGRVSRLKQFFPPLVYTGSGKNVSESVAQWTGIPFAEGELRLEDMPRIPTRQVLPHDDDFVSCYSKGVRVWTYQSQCDRE